MGRPPRNDEPGSLHHLFSCGLSHRTVFERDADVRYFLSRLAKISRLGLIEVIAYTVLTTHFHLLIRSPVAELSHAMRRVLSEYVRWFNRTRDRDGTLFRCRFGSCNVDSEAYLITVLRYIDDNPVDAKLVESPPEHLFGSAAHYVAGTSPPWLKTDFIESFLRDIFGSECASTEAYRRLLSVELTRGQVELVERRMRGPRLAADPLDDLLAAAPPAVLEWLSQRTRIADGTTPGAPVVSTHAIESGVLDLVESDAAGPHRRWLLAGMLRDLAMLRLREIAVRLGTSTSTAGADVAKHRRLMSVDRAYCELSAKALRTALAIDHPYTPIGRMTPGRFSDSRKNDSGTGTGFRHGAAGAAGAVANWPRSP